MRYREVLITGGAGFVGSSLAVWFANRYPNLRVTVVDNLRRRGSELSLQRLLDNGIEFVHGDIRNPEDLRLDKRRIDLIIECAAEPSVLAGYGEASDYLINVNLLGTVHCLELARRCGADFLFISTSRVYPFHALNSIVTVETETRLNIAPNQAMQGVSQQGISECFPLVGARSLYGATKLSSELLIHEYAEMYGLNFIINRCGVLAGPWQMGKVDQGVFTLWMARHYFRGELSYIGWGGRGKQVRDLLHVDDLANLLDRQLSLFQELSGGSFNVGGGPHSSLSLLEATELCRLITGNRVPIRSVPENRPADVKLYTSDNSRVMKATGWRPQRTPEEILASIYHWIRESEPMLRGILT